MSSSRHPASCRGAYVVTIRGVRAAVDAKALRAREIAGRPQALSWGCERLLPAQDERRCCVRHNRVVLAPVAGVKLCEDEIRPTGSGFRRQFAKRPRQEEFVSEESAA